MAARGSRRSAALLRIGTLLAFVAISCHLRVTPRAFVVKGDWSADVSEVLDTLPKGLWPVSVAGTLLNTSTSNGGNVGITVKDGKLVTKYLDGPLSVSCDDGCKWQANYSDGKASFRMRGSAEGPISWNLQKKGEVSGLGDVVVNMSSPDTSDPTFGVSVARELPEVAGVGLKGFVSAREQALYGRLEAQRDIGSGRELTYSVENPEGNYEVADLIHRVGFKASLVERGDVNIKLAREGPTNKYNVTYSTGKAPLLDGEVSAIVGTDNGDGSTRRMYGRVDATRDIAYGVNATYRMMGGGNAAGYNLDHALKFAHDLGSVEFSYLQTDANATAKSEGVQVKFNITGDKDLTSAVQKVEKSGKTSARIIIGADDAKKAGLYGKLVASRALPKEFTGEVSLTARGSTVTPAVKVSNRLASAEISKAPDASPRLRLGYEFALD